MINSIAYALGLALFLIGSLKVFGDLEKGALVTGSMARGIGMIEIAAALVLAFAPALRRYVCWGVIALCLGGLMVKVALPGRQCGCLGSLAGRDYLLVVGGLGVLATCWLWMAKSTVASGSRWPSTKRAM